MRVLAAVLACALILPTSAFAQPDNLNDRRPSTQKERDDIILQLKKTHFIERVDVHGGHARVYVGYEFYNPNLVRSELVRYIRILAGHFGTPQLDYMTPLHDGRIGIRIGEFTSKAGLVLKLPPPLANRPHRQPAPFVPTELPKDQDQLLALIVNWFDSGFLWNYDDSEPDQPKLHFGSTFFDSQFTQQQRKAIMEATARYYVTAPNGTLLLYDNDTQVQFGIYTKQKGLVLTPPPSLAQYFGQPTGPQPGTSQPSQLSNENSRARDLAALSCQQLWQARNEIFARNGFCFTTPDAQAVFGTGCFPPYGKLSAHEDRDAKAIQSLESAKGCNALSPRVQGASPGRALSVPVIVGTNGPNLDACAGNGEVVGLDPRGDGYLSVQSGPGGSPFTTVDRLFNGQSVYICDQKGEWLGVVYKPSNVLEMDCNVMTSWTTAQAYTGPCRVGWVYRRYVRPVAG